MGLGFTVEALVPAGRGGSALRMGLGRVAEADWLFPEVDREARIRAFDAQPDAVIVLPGAEAAAEEAAEVLAKAAGSRLSHANHFRHPGLEPGSRFLATEQGSGAPAQGQGDEGHAGQPLVHVARNVWEDLCLVERRGGQPVLTAGAVGFPTDWRLADKIGLPIAAVHLPIHGYAEQLSAGVDHFLETLPAGPIYGRANWFVVASDAWTYLPEDDPAERFAHVDAGNAGETLFVRCERQTLRRLPRTGAVLFTIGVAVAALGSLSAGVVRRVAEGVAAQSAGEQGRRAAPLYGEALLRYAAGLP